MIKIIPAIDIIDGKCVRLSKGEFKSAKIYNEDPLVIAKKYEQNGLQYLHLVDLDGARTGRVVNWEVIARIADKINLKIDFGGGISTSEDIRKIFSMGIKKVTVGSIAFKNRRLTLDWIERFGPEKIILGADVSDKKIVVSGWQENSGLGIYEYIKSYVDSGIDTVICTDISRDGMLNGPAINLYKKLKDRFPFLKIIASGGVSNITEIDELDKAGIYGVIIGKAILEGKVTFDDLEKYYVD